jgi:hypothetical protein
MRSYPLLKRLQFLRDQGISLADDGNNINTRREPSHQLDIHFPQTSFSVRVKLIVEIKGRSYAWPVGGIKYNRACTLLSLKRGLRLIRDCSAKMSSY